MNAILILRLRSTKMNAILILPSEILINLKSIKACKIENKSSYEDGRLKQQREKAFTERDSTQLGEKSKGGSLEGDLNWRVSNNEKKQERQRLEGVR